MSTKHEDGILCETILAEYFLRRGYSVFVHLGSHAPADLVVINNKTGTVYALDAKKNIRRARFKDRKKLQRVYRPRSKLQKAIPVHFAYIDTYTRSVHIVPPIEELELNGQVGQV